MQFPRVYLDIEVCFSVNVVDLVDPWLQISIFEDGRGIIGRFQCHGRQNECDTSVEDRGKPRAPVPS